MTASSSASDGLVRLGELVGLEALDALGTAGADRGLALPEIEGCFRHPQLLGQRAHLLADDQSRTDGPSELPCIYRLGMDCLLVAHDQTLISLDLDPKKWTTLVTIWP